MFLKKIEIQGFKSFANKTELLFDQNLTAIVGPNGSGKSNVADAIRWATGEQSQKLLRTKKSEEVIFAGSDTKNRLGLAEVSLFLDNHDKRAPIDYDEIVITRRVYRTGESEYIINKNKVRLIDVQLLLAQASFGQNNYSIIGQGMIDSILSQSSASRKNFFDEATGVREFQIKKEKSQLKYENTQENLEKSRLILNELSPRLKYLTKQVNKFSKLQETKSDLEESQNNYYGFLLNEIKAKIDTTKKELVEKNKAKEIIEKQLLDIENKLSQEENKNSYSKEFNLLQDKHEELLTSKNHLIHDRVVYQGKLDVEFSNTGKDNISWLMEQKNELEKEEQKNQKEIIEIENNLNKLSKELIEKNTRQEEFIAKINQIQQKLQENAQIDNSSDSINSDEIKLKINKLNTSFQKLILEIDTMEIGSIKQEIFFISKEIEYLHKNINKENGEDNTGIKKNYFRLQEEFNKYLLSKDSLVNEIFDLKNQKNSLDNKLSFLKQRQSEISSKIKKVVVDIEIANSKDRSQIQEQIESAVSNLNNKIADLDKEISKIKSQIDNLDAENEKNRKNIFELQKNARNIQLELDKLNQESNEINISLARLQTKEEDIKNEISQESVNIENLNFESHINKDEIFEKINRLKRQLSQIGEIEENVENEYSEVETKYNFLNQQIIDLENASKNIKEIIEDLNKKIEEKFDNNFKKINETFGKYFKILFNGGNAELQITKFDDLEKEETPEEIGGTEETEEAKTRSKKTANSGIADITMIVKIPGKKLTSVNFLSGGEKALTSIALVCAIIFNNPSPFVVLDEVDAALDEANSERFAEIVDMLKDKTQFICITHNRATMHKAETLYGVTMSEDGISKILSISFSEAKKYSEQ